jgi:hypothetical protein
MLQVHIVFLKPLALSLDDCHVLLKKAHHSQGLVSEAPAMIQKEAT